MKIKKYTGESFQEAFEKMKNELGSEAIILNSRRVSQGGALDYTGKKEYHEITAALDKPAPVAATKEDAMVYQRPRRKSAAPERGGAVFKALTETVSNGEDLLQQASQISELKDEVRDMRKVLEQVADFIKYSRMPALPEKFKTPLKQLVDNEVHEELAKAVMQTVYARTQPADYQDEEKIREQVFGLLGQMMKSAAPLEQQSHRPYVVALVGPTGVGKTTTVAKIAANLKLFSNRKVALISADTYRIAAIEQLQTFANIASIPMSVAYNPAEIQEAVTKYSDREIILIDTVGRSQKNKKQLVDLQRFIDAAEPHEVHLVLSLTSGLKTMLDIVQRFRDLKPNRLIFTKADETTGAGVMLNVLYKHQLPVSFITTGQTVPNDITAANPETLIKLVYQGEWD